MNDPIVAKVQTQASTGPITVTSTAASLSAASLKSKLGFVLRAKPNNAGVIYLGGPGVSTANGYPLNAGDSVRLPIEDLQNLYAVSSNASSVLLVSQAYDQMP